MVAHQGEGVHEADNAIDDHGEGNPEVVNGLAERYALPVPVGQNLDETSGREIGA